MNRPRLYRSSKRIETRHDVKQHYLHHAGNLASSQFTTPPLINAAEATTSPARSPYECLYHPPTPTKSTLSTESSSGRSHLTSSNSAPISSIAGLSHSEPITDCRYNIPPSEAVVLAEWQQPIFQVVIPSVAMAVLALAIHSQAQALGCTK